MPLTLIITEDALPKAAEQKTLTQLSEAFLKVHDLSGNPVLTPNVLGMIQIVKKEHSSAGLEASAMAIIEWKVPSFAFTDREVQRAYVQEATAIVQQASEGRLDKNKIWVNVVHAVDGIWGINGEALDNQQLLEAINGH